MESFRKTETLMRGRGKRMGRQVAILVESDFNDLEYWYPYYRLVEEGYAPLVVAPVAPRQYQGKSGTFADAAYTPRSIDFDLSAVVIPGGWAPDRIRMSQEMVALVQRVYASGGVVASICHGGSVLVSAGILKGLKATSYASVRDDMILAGAEWVDEPVVVCGRLITSRKPADLPLFAKALLHALGPAETIAPK